MQQEFKAPNDNIRSLEPHTAAETGATWKKGDTAEMLLIAAERMVADGKAEWIHPPASAIPKPDKPAAVK